MTEFFSGFGAKKLAKRGICGILGIVPFGSVAWFGQGSNGRAHSTHKAIKAFSSLLLFLGVHTMRKKKSNQRAKRLKRIGKRLAAYSAAAAATTVAGQGMANAADKIFDIADITVGPAAKHGVVFNLMTGATKTIVGTTNWWTGTGAGSIRLMGYYAGYPNPYIYSPSKNGSFVVTSVGASTAAPLAPSALVDSKQTFGFYLYGGWPSVGRYVNLGNWSVGQRASVGITFDFGGNTHYGWADITRVTGTPGVVTLHAFGWNDQAGAAAHIPEPSSILLLAAGAAGLGLWRRKKKV